MSVPPRTVALIAEAKFIARCGAVRIGGSISNRIAVKSLPTSSAAGRASVQGSDHELSPSVGFVSTGLRALLPFLPSPMGYILRGSPIRFGLGFVNIPNWGVP